MAKCTTLNAVEECLSNVSDYDFSVLKVDNRIFSAILRTFIGEFKAKWEDMLKLHASAAPSTAALEATPATNDFVEGYFGYMATLGAKLGPNIHPMRLCSLATFAYNREVLLLSIASLDRKTLSSTLSQVRNNPEWVSHKEVCRRVHKTLTCTKNEGVMMDELTAGDTVTLFRQVFGP